LRIVSFMSIRSALLAIGKPDSLSMQRAEEDYEVFDLMRVGVAASWRVIHSSASSWLAKRYSPRGTRAFPRSRFNVR